MKIYLREMNDALCMPKDLKRGLVNIVDLANVDSCAFIATQDIAYQENNNEFKIMGRADNSEIRGCNLLLQL
jgi:hypothetical protein